MNSRNDFCIEKSVRCHVKLFGLRAGSVFVCGLILFSGCRVPLTKLESIVQRHREAMAELPPEDSIRIDAYGTPVPMDYAKRMLPEGELTIEDARGIAVRANPDIHTVQARLEAAAARIEEARAQFFPQIFFAHNTTRVFQRPSNGLSFESLISPNAVATPAPQGTNFLTETLRNLVLGSDVNKPNRSAFSEHTTGLSLSWTVFDGYIRDAQLRAAKYVHRASAMALADMQRIVVQAVDTAYFRVQLAEEQLRISKADETFSQEQLQETQKLETAGRATLSDVNNFRVRMLVAKANVTAAMGNREIGRVALAELMGLDGVDLPVALELSPLQTETPEAMAKPLVSQCIQDALTNRPDTAQLKHLVHSREAQVRAAKGLAYPLVAATGSWGFNDNTNIRYSNEDQTSAAIIAVRWALYTGGAIEARVRETEAQLDEAEARERRIVLAVQSEVKQAVIALTDAQAQIVLRREALETSFENRRIVQAAYLGGKQPLTRLNETQRDYIAADANLARARIRLRQAWSELDAATATQIISEEN